VLAEPTAGLDADTEAALLRGLRETGVAALVVSHRPAVIGQADQVITVGAQSTESTAGAAADALTSAAPDTTAASAHVPGERKPDQPGPVSEPAEPDAAARPDPHGRSALRRLIDTLFEALPNARSQLALALLLAFAASAASVALMAVSAWLLSRAAERPPVLYLQVAAVGVRFFGISRGVFRYLERLAGHDIALRLQSALRVETYTRLARTTLLGRRRGDLLARIIADVEAIQDLIVRVWIPFASAALVILATTLGLAFFSPGSAAVLLASAVLAALVVPALAMRASVRADAAAVPTRGRLADSVHDIARTAPDLVAYGADGAYLDRLVAVDRDLRLGEQRSSWIRGVATAAQVLAAGIAVIAALVIGGGQAASGTLAPVMLAVLVLTPLALHDVMGTLTQAAQTATRARIALERVHAVISAPPVGAGDLPLTSGNEDRPGIALRGVTIGWPDGSALLTGLDLDVAAGERVALVGPSGVGKTTVAATVLGLIPPQAGGLDVRGRIGYLAQDAHIFTTTIAENVRLGNRDATDDDILRALGRAGLDLDPGRLVGESGATLSGGEARRVALARLLVGEYRVWILDEPTEHLDAATASALLDDLWATTIDRPVLVMTHDPEVIRRCDRVVRLG